MVIYFLITTKWGIENMGYRHYGVNTGGLPVDYIKRFTEVLDIAAFIETGTAGGESVIAASSFFRDCHTIEIVDGRADREYPASVRRYTGNSPSILPGIVSEYKNQWVFFWLDAHWSEPYESKEDEQECPLIDEIKSIDHSKSIIMIDDARLFTGPVVWPCNPKKWPHFKDVFLNLQYKWPDHIITVVDDYIVCLPQELRDVFFAEWRGRYLERYPTEEQKDRIAAKRAYENLMRYIG